MKKFAIGLCVLVLALGGGAWYLYRNLDSIVARAIESTGSAAVGSPVRVGGVSIDLASGRASIRDFSVANPAGYSTADMLTFEELTVVLDTARLSTTEVGIVSILARSPRLLYEVREERSNVDTMLERLAGTPTPRPTGPAEARAVQVAIGSIDIAGISAALQAAPLPAPVEVNLGNIALENLEGTPVELGQQILRPLLTQLSRNAGAALLSATAAQLRDNAAALGQQALDQAGRQINTAGEALGETGSRLREGFGNLLDRDDADDADAAQQ